LQLFEKRIGGNVQEQTELVSLEAVTTRPVRGELALPFLDAVFNIFAALAIALVHLVQRFLPIGDHEVLANHTGGS